MLLRLAFVPESDAERDWEAEPFSARLEHALGVETPYAFAKRIGMNDSTFRTYLAGKEPRRDVLVIFSEALNVLLDWLAAGRGPIRPTKPAEVVSFEAATTGELVPVQFVTASASAGPGLIPISEDEVIEMFSTTFLRRYGLYPRSTSALMVEGDSMLKRDGTGIPSGAMALINTAITDDDVITGCIYVLVRGSELLIKRIERHVDGTMTLHSDNPRYKPQHIRRDAMHDFHIVGRFKVAVLEF